MGCLGACSHLGCLHRHVGHLELQETPLSQQLMLIGVADRAHRACMAFVKFNIYQICLCDSRTRVSHTLYGLHVC